MLDCPPNDWLINCKRPYEDLWSIPPLGGWDAGGARVCPLH